MDHGFTGGRNGIALLMLLYLPAMIEGELQQSVRERTKSLVLQGKTATQVAGNVNERFKIWKKTIQLVKDKPIAGAGPGNWKLAISAYGTEGLAWANGKLRT